MKRNRFLLIFSAVSLFAFGALAGCDADEDPIGGVDGSGDGSGDDGSGDGSGEVACTDGSECAEGEVCENDICVEAPMGAPYLFVAVVSNAQGDDALGTNTPGPDIDAIQLIKGGVDNFAATVEGSTTGPIDDAEGNANDDPSLVTGANDAMAATSGEDCNLAEVGDGGQFYSMGGDGGYVIVGFATGIEVEDGDTVNVWELSDETCTNVNTVRPDAYSVYIGTDAASVTSAADISAANGWQLLGASGANGGIFSQVVTIAMDM